MDEEQDGNKKKHHLLGDLSGPGEAKRGKAEPIPTLTELCKPFGAFWDALERFASNPWSRSNFVAVFFSGIRLMLRSKETCDDWFNMEKGLVDDHGQVDGRPYRSKEERALVWMLCKPYRDSWPPDKEIDIAFVCELVPNLLAFFECADIYFKTGGAFAKRLLNAVENKMSTSRYTFSIVPKAVDQHAVREAAKKDDAVTSIIREHAPPSSSSAPAAAARAPPYHADESLQADRNTHALALFQKGSSDASDGQKPHPLLMALLKLASSPMSKDAFTEVAVAADEQYPGHCILFIFATPQSDVWSGNDHCDPIRRALWRMAALAPRGEPCPLRGESEEALVSHLKRLNEENFGRPTREAYVGGLRPLMKVADIHFATGGTLSYTLMRSACAFAESTANGTTPSNGFTFGGGGARP